MPTFLIPFLIKHWVAIALALLVAGALGYVGHLRSEVKHDQVNLARYAASTKVWARSVRTLEAAITTQNARVRALGVEGVRTQAAAAKALAHAQAGRAAAEKRLASIARTKHPIKGICQDKAADALILGNLP